MDARAPDDQALMAAMAAGDARALGVLYDRYAGVLMALCLRIVKDAMAAEEVLEDVFWQAWRQAGQFDARRGPPLAFLVNVARSRAIDRFRAGRSHSARVVTQSQLPAGRPNEAARPGGRPGAAPANDPLAATEAAERRHHVLKALGVLGPEQRQVVLLAYFDAMSHSEIARQLGLPLGTVKTRMRQALVHLREALRKMYGPEASGGKVAHGSEGAARATPPGGAVEVPREESSAGRDEAPDVVRGQPPDAPVPGPSSGVNEL